jgi:hypothetical protein
VFVDLKPLVYFFDFPYQSDLFLGELHPVTAFIHRCPLQPYYRRVAIELSEQIVLGLRYECLFKDAISNLLLRDA